MKHACNLRDLRLNYSSANAWGTWKGVPSPENPLLRDAFHPPFPESTELDSIATLNRKDNPNSRSDIGHSVAMEVTKIIPRMDSGTSPTGDLLRILPIEVSDMILSYLSPAALDAVRHTSRYWRQNIMTNYYVLSAVIKKRKAQTSSATENCHPWRGGTLRDFIKWFDQDSSLYADPDTWRTRFRARSLEFTTTESVDELSDQPYKFKTAARVGIQLGFMIFQMGVQTHSVLLFFRFDSGDFPLYVGSVESPGSQGSLDSIRIIKLYHKQSALLEITMDEEIKLYLVRPREAFAKFDTRFSVMEIGPSQIPQHYDPVVDENLVLPSYERAIGISKITYTWKSLASSPTEQHLIAHIASGNLLVVKGGNALREQLANDDIVSDGEMAVLSQPHLDSVYRNVATALIASMPGIVRVAVIWQVKHDEDRRTELYIYDISQQIVYERYTHCIGQRSISGSPEPTHDFSNLPRIQGKRITSLNPRWGGIHPSSPIITPKRLQEEASVGGLQLPHTVKTPDSHPYIRQYQKCFVWGPVVSGNTLTIECKVLDLSFSDPKRMDPKSRLNCACALHDDGFRITLPSVVDITQHLHVVKKIPAAPKLQKSSFWPWKFRYTPAVTEPMPLTARNDSAARQAALDRETEWFNDRIKCMRKAGLSDWDISELWGCAHWTQYGQKRKPDGWREPVVV